MTFDLRSLNLEQQAAVTTTEGPLLVLAGAGSGKTRVITSRIAYLIRNRKVKPSEILAVTFTNKASREMAERVRKSLKGMAVNSGAVNSGAGKNKAGKKTVEQPLICTFHAFGVRLLRVHIGLLGYRTNFVIMDSGDQQSLLKTIMEEGDYDTEVYAPAQTHFALQQAKSRGLSPQALSGAQGPPDQVMLGSLMAEYQSTLKRLNAIDFEDILQLSLRLCREHPAEVGGFFSRFRYVLVDEYQDTNRTQYELLRALTRGHGNLCVVGDDDQSIYHWRGAEPGNILDFERDFPGAVTIRLERNYRSTDTILEAANQVIGHNAERKAKRLHGGQGPGEPLGWLLGENEVDEMEKVVTHLKRTRLETGAPLDQFAILYRSNFQSRAVEERMREEGIPYLLVGGTRFFDRREIKDALAYLRLIANPADEVSLQRVINFPRRGIGATSRVRLSELAQRLHKTNVEAMAEATQHAVFPPEAARSMEHFSGLLTRYEGRFAAEPLGPVFRDLLAEVGFHRAMEKDRGGGAAGEKASGLVRELELSTDRFARNREDATLADYLEYIALFNLPGDDDTPDKPMVSLMTVHAAKGLEFPYVYVIGMAEDVFPNQRALAESGDEEERRLFYVALTRARKQAVFSMARARKRYSEILPQQPSRFLLEIEPRLFGGDAPSLSGPTAEVKAVKTEKAKARYFAQMQKLRGASGDAAD